MLQSVKHVNNNEKIKAQKDFVDLRRNKEKKKFVMFAHFEWCKDKRGTN